MKYEKGTFLVVPRHPEMKGKPSEMQAIYAWLCSYSDKDGYCYPSRTTLAKNAGCSVRTLDKYMQELVDCGFIVKEQRMMRGSKQKLSNAYYLQLVDKETLEALDAASDKNNIREVQEMHEGYIKNSTRGSVKSDRGTIPTINYTHLTDLSGDKSLVIPTDNNQPLQELKPIQDIEEIFELTDKPEDDVPIEYQPLGSEYGVSGVERVMSFYRMLYLSKFGVKYLGAIKSDHAFISRFLDGKTERQAIAVMYVFFHWHGGSGNDQREYNYLSEKYFPLAMLLKNQSNYIAYLTNRLSVEYTKPISIQKYIVNNYKSLISKYGKGKKE